jgi:hypothetical protein
MGNPEVVMDGQMKIAKLDQGSVAKIREMEKEMGVHIMALEPGVKFIALAPEQLAKVEALEKELGVILLVYEPVK